MRLARLVGRFKSNIALEPCLKLRPKFSNFLDSVGVHKTSSEVRCDEVTGTFMCSPSIQSAAPEHRDKDALRH